MGRRVIDKRYELLERLGSGGIGEVYKVRDRIEEAILALKLTRKDLPEMLKLAFKKEFYTLASLRHPNVVKVHDFGRLPDGRSYFTMDFVPGQPITRVLKGFDRRLYALLVHILSALDYIHSRGLIHGDLKPENIIITRDKRRNAIGDRRGRRRLSAKILDFGFAEEIGLLDPTCIKGTVGYLAPELLKGGEVDARIDLYSLGIVLYETLTQRRAFRGKNATEVLRSNLEKTLPSPKNLNPGIPHKLEQIILKLIQKDPRDRYENTGEVLEGLASVTKAAAPRRARARVSKLFYSPTVGREEALSLLEDALSRAKQNRGQLVLISGETGIGKSRLLREFKLRVQLSGCRVISLSCSTPDLIAQFYGQLSFASPKLQTGEPAIKKLRTFNQLANSVIRYVEKSKAPAVFLLDDLDRADPTGQEFAAFLSRSLRSDPAAVVATCEEKGLSDRLTEGVRDEPFLTEMSLSGLSHEETEALISNLLNTREDLDPLPDWTYRRTHGNPLLIEETLRCMLGQGVLRRRRKRWILNMTALGTLRPSRTMEALAGVWVGRLSDREADLLSTASVLGESFSLHLLKDLSALEESDVLELISSLQRQGLMTPDHDSHYRFSRRWIQDYLYQRIDIRKRKALHKKVARILEKEPPERREELLPLLAHHYRKAGVRAKAFQFSLEAGEKLEGDYSAEAALDHYREALRVAPSHDRFELLMKIGELHQGLGFHSEALQYYQSALRLKGLGPDERALVLLMTAVIHRRSRRYREALNAIKNGLTMLRSKKSRVMADLLTERGRISMDRGDYDRAAEYCRKAEEISTEIENESALSNVYHILGLLHWRRGELKTAIQYTRKALGLREKLMDRPGTGRSYNNLGVIYWTKGDMDKAATCYEHALKEFEELGDIRGIADIHLNLGLLAWNKGDWEGSLRHSERSYALFDRLGDRAALAAIHNHLGMVDEQRGNWSKALKHYQAHRAFHKKIGDPQGEAIALTNLGSLFLKLGEFEKCKDSLEESLFLNEELHNEEGIALSLLNLGMLRRDRSAWDLALDHLDRSITIYEKRNLEKDLPTARRVASEVLIGKGDLRAAQQSAGKALSLAKKLSDRLELGHIHRTLGMICSKRGDGEGAERHFEQALRTFQDLRVRYELARTLLHRVSWRLKSMTDLGSAAAELARAEDIFTRLGAKADLETAHQLGSLFIRTVAEAGGPMAREAQLEALYEVSGVMSSILDMTVLSNRMVDLAVSLLKAERGLLLLMDDKGELAIAAGREMDSATIKDAATLSRSVVSEVADKGLPVISDDASADPRFRKRESVILNNIHSLLCVPLKLKEKIIGTFYVDSRVATKLFSPQDLSFLNAVANLLAVAIENATLHEELRQETNYLRREVSERYRLGSLVGKSEAMQTIFSQIETVSKSNASVLIEGETGTGKELVARAIHYNGARKAQRFIPVECGALPETLAESELFGHKKGAFTDAREDRPGLFEEADTGTIFLDQIDNLSLKLQAKLLRVLQNGEVRRVGESKTRRVDVRVICATNKNLKEEVKGGRFRDDLYFRLNTFHLHIPPLRDRRDDIPLLASHFLDQFSSKEGKNLKDPVSEALKCLLAYSWPGNVRELEHEIERAVILAKEGRAITTDLLSDEVLEASNLSKFIRAKARGPLKRVMADIERQLVLESLKECSWNQTKAARALGISRPSLIEKMRRYRIRREA